MGQLAQRSRGLSDDVGLRAVFSTWLTIAVVIAFMFSSVWSYASVTLSELSKAEDEVRSGIDYICYQLGRDVRATSTISSSSATAPMGGRIGWGSSWPTCRARACRRRCL